MRLTVPRLKLPLRHKFLLCTILIVVPALGIIFAWMALRSQEHITEQIVNQARVLCRQVILTRQWVSDSGGVMVAADSKGAKGTHYFYNDRMDTSRGVFQRFTPSMVTKKLSNYSLRENLYQLDISSNSPMNPDNRPDEFEQSALFHFNHQHRKEFYSLDLKADTPSFRYSVPLYVEEACLKCHAGQGFTNGTIGGTLSVRFPAGQLKHAIRTDRLRLVGAGASMILLTTAILLFLLRTVVIKPLKELETMTDEIGNGNLAARVTLRTGDEFERLGQAFNHMGSRLSRNREVMEEKIVRATRELSEANVELQKLDRLKTDFFADMSHEMRSPITAIQGGVDYLKRTLKPSDDRAYLTIIDKNLQRLTRLVSELLDLTRIEAGKVAWNFETADLAELIREVIEILSLKAGRRHITLAHENTDPILAEIDTERMEQVLVNLVENAIKFSHEGGRIHIATRVDAGTIHLSVKDSGIGIAQDELERVFEKFHTLPSGGGSRGQGTGLGLTICRRIVEAHGGTIRVESTLGEGSIFHVSVPLRQPGPDVEGWQNSNRIL